MLARIRTRSEYPEREAKAPKWNFENPRLGKFHNGINRDQPEYQSPDHELYATRVGNLGNGE